MVDDVTGPGGHGQHKGGGRPHAVSGFELFRDAHERAKPQNLDQHDVVDQDSTDEDEKVMSHQRSGSERGIIRL